ncbi:hypothetical protein Cst_c12760 [Thermoclostridium stercorarium subsp. stercorarium DSM 8532]|jgi:competence protein ComFB|uniref:Competence protein ComF n=3 Tax=Thermoclostridium stercorarium TaxID=1510 RepID=L7VNC9_THES1|nr:late competence development ComFB family protein [Thermoclostridium stercorarium]AGC68267.1 hypothetical protein Cst_c12760 [Thermoclostridium stercorarium subsp. stercorarium DSM 8532]AGI39294.1 ComFB [Thermoclostridium stercorarium subsp. stercorarium DSM 8532]ANW98627.1 competence protein ComF [Thermoclostridium stercorarium subsp. thermolacticum DSM 2910]ANX01168.1 competence protein ComF [Thermoclostridium stercorarium subsp. leptospartum DSM 9219]UZQ86782.1 late competence development
MELKNYMEEIVFNFIDDVLKDIDMCKCDICKLDVAAKALNELPPQYFVTEKGEVYSKINNLRLQFEVDVISAITRAAEVVRKKPRHDIK